MSDKANTRRITKSIRMTPAEAAEMAALVNETPYSEAALMREWVVKGMRQFRIDQAIRAYQEERADLRSAAERARLPVAVLLEEMAQRKVAALDREDAFGPGLDALREAFGDHQPIHPS